MLLLAESLDNFFVSDTIYNYLYTELFLQMRPKNEKGIPGCRAASVNNLSFVKCNESLVASPKRIMIERVRQPKQRWWLIFLVSQQMGSNCN